ncbi:N-acetylmuramoyl-L-alanine amidase [Leptodesmis sp.]|uniref:N-acetylmuramoyl-L-alanine amidase n=1 Tax=Leptodesmis sp. TaxID=3100501 RepID=UPI0040534FA3
MKLRWLFPGLVGAWLLLTSIASATTLQSWRFDSRQNQLELSTDEGVQPRARLLYNPTRLVIDLPGTKLGRPKQTEAVSGKFATLRVAQFDRETTRIVLELDRGYTLDPKQIRVRYNSARQWIVELPPAKFSPLLATSEILPSQDIEVPQAPVAVSPPVSATEVQPTPVNQGLRLPRSLSTVPNGRRVVVIDPGHGGPDPGAVGIGGLRETDIVLDISQQVTSLLEQQDITVVLTRNGEYDLGLEPRVQMAERANATIFVSIHANAMPANRSDINGVETYYYNTGKQLAQVIHQTILEDTGARDRRVRQARFYVIRRTSMPAVLLEVGFVTGVEDAAQLRTPTYRSRMAAAIARGILRYLGQGE